MRLNRQAEIAVGILAACARTTDRRRLTRDLAQMTGTTPYHAAQIISLLGREGYLLGSRGRGGGLTLARPADAIPLIDVLRLMQPELADTVPSGNAAVCPVGQRFSAVVNAAIDNFLRAMSDITIADLLAEEVPISITAYRDRGVRSRPS